jgi:hypothetical protein
MCVQFEVDAGGGRESGRGRELAVVVRWVDVQYSVEQREAGEASAGVSFWAIEGPMGDGNWLWLWPDPTWCSADARAKARGLLDECVEPMRLFQKRESTMVVIMHDYYDYF